MTETYIYSETTECLKISVEPNFIEDLSSLAESLYIWAYDITLENFGNETIQLISRSWKIIDKLGQIQKVDGPGVVGQKPVLGPNESFKYSSHAELTTSSGIMTGTYEMVYLVDGRKFIAKIPSFSLDMPNEKKLLH